MAFKPGDIVVVKVDALPYKAPSPANPAFQLKKGDQVIVVAMFVEEHTLFDCFLYRCKGNTYRSTIEYPDMGWAIVMDFEFVESARAKETHKCHCPKTVLYAQGCKCGGI